MCGCVGGWVDRRMDRWTDGRTDEQMDGWIANFQNDYAVGY